MKQLLLLALLGGYVSSSAQVATLKHSYTIGVTAFNTDGGYKYFGYEAGGNKVSIYNTDHSLYKEVSVPDKAMTVNPYLNKGLFNTDSKYEFILSTLVNGEHKAYIVNEDGQILQTFDNGNTWAVKNIDGHAVLIMSNYGGGTDIYELQGTYTGLKPEAKEQGETGIYPNPVETAATIVYKLPEGTAQATLSIYSANGVLIKQLQVTNQFDNILIPRGDISPGYYHYQVTAPGMQPMKQSFVIR